MLLTFKRFYEAYLDPSSTATNVIPDHAPQLATAALLIEVGRADFNMHDDELDKILELVKSKFELSQEESDALVELAHQHVDDATSLHSFTSLINKEWSIEKKVEAMEMMWRVAYADGHVDSHEHHLLRKIAGLLYIPHKEYIGAKLNARPND